MTTPQSLPNDTKKAILADRKALLKHTDLIPDPRYPLFEETLLYLMAICHHYQPKRILETGSGLTSILLRKYNPKALLITVDDDNHWLEQTDKLFHRFDPHLHHQHQRSIINERVFKQYPWNEKFDMLVHDIGNMSLRLHTLPSFITYTTPQCVTLLDNFGISPYKELAHPFLLSKGFVPLYPTDPMTLTVSNAGGFAVYTRGHRLTKDLYNILL